MASVKETEDPATWIWTAADKFLLKLIAEVHRRGMKIILDGVFNHTGRDFFAFKDLLAHGADSRYKKWYKLKHWNADGTFEYEGWFGHSALPELARTEHDLIRPVRQYVFDITRRWMDPDGDGNPSDGIDGWRLDVAFCVPHGFWKKWRKHVKRINPQAYLTAEIVTLARDYLKGDEFDAVMNYMWLFPSVSFFSNAKKAMKASALMKSLNEVRSAYPEQVSFVQQNLFDSHDVGRVSSVMNNPEMLPIENFEQYFHLSRVKHGGKFRTTKPTAMAMTALKQAVIFQMTYMGAPMIYYGTEVGMWGGNDPCDRQAMLWDDIRFEPESHTPAGKTKPRARKPDPKLFAFYQNAIAMRQSHAVLRRGDITWRRHKNPRVLMFDRSQDGVTVRVILNAGKTSTPVSLPFSGVDLWSGKAIKKGVVKVPSRGWLVIRKG